MPRKKKPTVEELRAELEQRERELAKRRNKPGFSANVLDLEARIAALRAEIETRGGVQ